MLRKLQIIALILFCELACQVVTGLHIGEFCNSSGLMAASPVTITGVSSYSGKRGDEISIFGTGFNSGNSIVYIGGVKAEVLSTSSTTQINFKVPCGSQHDYITVVNTAINKAAKSLSKFHTRFSSVPITDKSAFKPEVDVTVSNASGSDKIFQSELADLNNDGKLDLISSSGANGFSVFRNSGSLKVDNTTYPATSEQIFTVGYLVNYIETADLDADGKLDVLVSDEYGIVKIFQNTSTAAVISLSATPVALSTSASTSIAYADINQDGLLDVIVNQYLQNLPFLLFLNTSTGGTISFSASTPIAHAGRAHDIELADLDGDGLEELIAADETNGVLIYKYSTGFTLALTVPFGDVYNVETGDYNGDDKLDLLGTTFRSSPKISSNTTSGSLSFGSFVDVPNTGGAFSASGNDLDGDGKIDVQYVQSSGSIGVAPNLGTSMSAAIVVNTYSGTLFNITSGDLNCDNYPDLVVSNLTNANVRIIPNEPPIPIPSQPQGNRGMYFDGVDDQVKSAAVNLNDFTIEFWIKTKQTGGTSDYWQNGFGLVDAEDQNAPNDYGVSLGNGKIVAGMGDGNPSPEDFAIRSVRTINDGAWHHVAVTRAGNAMQIFIDGLQDASGSATDVVVPVGNVPLTFGSIQTNLNYFNGQLDEIKIFKSIRTPDEIKSDMSSTATQQTGLYHYWDFEDDLANGNQTTAKDLVNSNNGTLLPAASGPLWALRTTLITDDLLPGTLRWAIEEANSDSDTDYIDFSIQQVSTSVSSTINLSSSLTVSFPTVVDGYSAYGSSPNTVPVFNATTGTPMNAANRIILGNGANIPVGLTITGNNSVIKGLVLQDFGDGTPSLNDIAISVSGNSNQILGCIIGLDATGTTAAAKTNVGVYITGGSNSIGNATAAGANIISGTVGNGEGVKIDGATASSNSLKGNMIGLQKNGETVPPGSGQAYGVWAYKASNIVLGGDITLGEGNVISGNDNAGFYCDQSNGNIIRGNIFGPKASGLASLSPLKQSYGVAIDESASNVIGGSLPEYRNIISGNGTAGVIFQRAGCTNNIVQGNYIGLDKTGTVSISGSSQDYGVMFISNGLNDVNAIGGDASKGEGNVISGNTARGIYATSAFGHTITGNIIGPLADGVSAVPANIQLYGVYLSSSTGFTIGSALMPDKANVIAYNITAGINQIGQNNAILRNRIFCNAATSADGIVNAQVNVTKPALTGYISGGIATLNVANMYANTGDENEKFLYFYKNTLCSKNQGEIFVRKDSIVNQSAKFSYSGSGFAAGDIVTVMYRSEADGSSVFSDTLTLKAPLPAAALDFDGTDDYATVPAGKMVLNNKSFTIEFWAKRNANTASNYICGQGAVGDNTILHVGFQHIGITSFRFAFYNNDVDYVAPVTTDMTSWHHWAVVYESDSHTQKIYLDGDLVAQRVSTSHYLGSGEFSIGRATTLGNYFSGQIDEFRIWERALCAGEIKNNMDCDNLADTKGLISQYSFNQGIAGGINYSPADMIAADASGNGNDAPLNNFKLSGPNSNWVTPGAVLSGTSCSPNTTINTITVNSIADAGPETLRQAIIDANTACDSTVINIATSGTITLASSLPVITKAVTIIGNGIKVSGSKLYNLFVINNVKASISNMTIAEGLAKGGDGESATINGTGGGGGAGLGGGLAVTGVNSDVFLTNIIFERNKAAGGNGGMPAWNFDGASGGGGKGNLLISGLPGTAGIDNGTGEDGGLFSGGGGSGHSEGNPKGGNGGLFAGGGGSGIPNPSGGAACPAPIALGGLFGGNGGVSCGGSNPNGGGGGAGLGGAIFVFQGKITISNVKFNENTATGGVPGSNAQKGLGKGAAVAVHAGAILVFAGSNTFDGNLASGDACTLYDNDAIYNGNATGTSYFPAQADYSLTSSGDNTKFQINLKWTPCYNSGTTTFSLERSVGNNTSYVPLATFAGNKTAHNDAVAPNTFYYYRIKGTNADGSSGEYSEKMFSTMYPPGSGSAINLPNTGELKLADPIFLTGSNTFEAWFVSPLPENTNNTLIKTSSDHPVLTQGNVLGAWSSTAGFVSSGFNMATLSPGWHHIAAVATGGITTFYIDGIAVGSSAFQSTQSVTTIGNNAGGGQSFGTIDEVRIWNTARTILEIRKEMCQKLKTSAEPNLVRYFPLDENIGNVVENRAANANTDALLSGATWITSGAAIGNLAAYEYLTGSTVQNLQDKEGGKFFKVHNFNLSAGQGIQIYRIDEAPNTQFSTYPVAGADSVQNSRYFGVFPVGVSSFAINYNYTANTFIAGKTYENSIHLARRAQNDSTLWTLSDSRLDTKVDTISVRSQTKRGEYIIAFAPLPKAAATGKLCVNAGNASCHISWNEVPEALKGYKVIYTTSAADTANNAATFNGAFVKGADTTITGLTNNLLYYFAIISVDGDTSKWMAAVPVLQSGYALILNGLDQFVSIPSVSAANLQNADFTLEAWIKTISGGIILSNRTEGSSGNFYVLAVGGGKLGVEINSSSTTANVAFAGNKFVADGLWHHVALVRKGLAFSMFVDGILDAANSGITLANVGQNKKDLFIGARYYEDQMVFIQHFNGQIDEVRVWNKALDQNQLNQNKDFPRKGAESGLIGLWHFDEPAGNVAYTGICNGINGTWVGLPATVASKAMYPFKPTGLVVSAGKLTWKDTVTTDLKTFTMQKKGTATWDSVGTTLPATKSFDVAPTCTTEYYRVLGMDSAGQVGSVSDSLEVKPASSLDNGLVLYYPMDGNFKDASPVKIDGAASNGATIVPATDRKGNASSAMYFDGSGHVDTQQKLSFPASQSYTISLWTKLLDPDPTTDGNLTLLARSSDVFDYDYVLKVNNKNNSTTFSTWANGGSNNNTEVAYSFKQNSYKDNWHNIIITYRPINATYSIFEDGILKSSRAGWATDLKAYGNLFVGGGSVGGVFFGQSNNFKGFLDEVKIYNRVLTPEEIALNSESILPDTITECPGTKNNYVLSATALPAASYKWTNPDGSTRAETGNAISIATLTSANTGKYNVIAIKGCSVIKDSVALIMPSSDTSIIITGSTILCKGNSVTFTAVKPLGNDTLRWFKKSSGVLSKMTNENTLAVKDTGSYYFRRYVGSCYDSSRVIKVTFIKSGIYAKLRNDTTFCDGGSLLLTAKATSDWYYGSQKLTTIPSQTYMAGFSGAFRAISTGACKDTSAFAHIKVIPPVETILKTDKTQICAKDSATLTVSAINGNSFKFNGKPDSYLLKSGAEISYDGQLTTELWLKTSSKDPGQYIVSYDPVSFNRKNIFSVFDPTSLKFEILTVFSVFTFSTEIFDTKRDVSDGKWHHVAFVFNKGVSDFYLDGKFIQKFPFKNNGNYTQPIIADLIIGQNKATGTNTGSYTGEMDELRFWSVALDSNTIKNNYNIELRNDEPGLFVLAHLNDVPGSKLAKEVKRGYDLTISDNVDIIEGGGVGNLGSIIPGYSWLGSTANTNSIKVGNAGVYSVKITNGFCTGASNTVKIYKSDFSNIAVLPKDTFSCAGKPVRLTVTSSPNLKYSWNNDVGENFKEVSQGTYILTIDSATICPAKDTITVKNLVIRKPAIIDTVICKDGTVSLKQNLSSAYNVNWEGPEQTGTGSTFTATTPGVYTVSVDSAQRCTVADTFNIRELNINVDLGLDDTIVSCSGQPVQVGVTSVSGINYNWNSKPGNSKQTFASGKYILQADSLGLCPVSDSVIISLVHFPVTKIKDTLICNQVPYNLVPAFDAGYGLTLSGNGNNVSGTSFNISTGGLYILTLDSLKCLNEYPFEVLDIAVKARIANLPDDTIFCGLNSFVAKSPAGTYKYKWLESGNPKATTSDYTIPANGDYSLELDSLGCKSVSDTVKVTFITKPSMPTLSQLPDICAGQTLSFLTITGTAPNVTFDVYRNNVFVSNIANSVIDLTAIDIDPAVAGITKIGIRQKVSICLSDTANVLQKVIRVPFSPVLGPFASVCRTDDIPDFKIFGELGAIFNVTKNAKLYSNSTGIFSAQNLEIDKNVDDAYILSATQVVLGCESQRTSNQTFTVRPRPVNPVIAFKNDSVICRGNTVELYVTQSYGSYQWFMGNKKIVGATAQTYQAVINSDYSVVVDVGATTCPADTPSVRVTSAYSTASGSIPQVTSFGQGSSVLLSGSAVASGYQWYVDNKLIVNANGKDFITKYNGNYRLMFNFGALCHVFSDPVPVSINGFETALRVGVLVGDSAIYLPEGNYLADKPYPNPFNETLNIPMGNAQDGSSVQILNMQGVTVLQQENAVYPASVQTQNLASGMYFLKIISNSGTRLFLIEKSK